MLRTGFLILLAIGTLAALQPLPAQDSIDAGPVLRCQDSEGTQAVNAFLATVQDHLATLETLAYENEADVGTFTGAWQDTCKQLRTDIKAGEKDAKAGAERTNGSWGNRPPEPFTNWFESLKDVSAKLEHNALKAMEAKQRIQLSINSLEGAIEVNQGVKKAWQDGVQTLAEGVDDAEWLIKTGSKEEIQEFLPTWKGHLNMAINVARQARRDAEQVKRWKKQMELTDADNMSSLYLTNWEIDPVHFGAVTKLVDEWFNHAEDVLDTYVKTVDKWWADVEWLVSGTLPQRHSNLKDVTLQTLDERARKVDQRLRKKL